MIKYNPDVLTCLANLSNDEVFTPPDLVNSILDMLPSKIWSDENITFLDPCCKSGVFLREIAKRLIKGLENKIPLLEERLNHIYTKQLFGVAITELTALLSRRSLYCSKYANGKYSVCTKFNTTDGNIFFKKINHTWKKGRCTFCGASQSEYDRDSSLETHAYQFIHTTNLEDIFKMKFDVIIGNPPYQMSDGGGTGDSAKPIYQLFIQQAKKLSPRYITMIIPSRWMKGGKGLDSFREDMVNDTKIEIIHDFADASSLFPNIHLDGGACYFLWNKIYNGKVNYYYNSLENEVSYSKRYLKENFSNTVIRDVRQISILTKIFSYNEEKFSSIVSARNPYGLSASLFNNPSDYPQVKLKFIAYLNSYKVYGVKGKKGGAKRMIGYVRQESIRKNSEGINKYKLFFSKAYMTTSTVPPEIIVGEPNTVCTETFLKIGDFLKEKEALNCLEYIKTKFFRALLFYNRHSLNISRDSFEFVPLQNFNESWTDEKLYKKYELSKEEIDFIESMIKSME